MRTATATTSDHELIYQLEGRPSFKTAFPLGLQHVLAMFIGNLAPCLIIGGLAGLSPADKTLMVQCAMFVSGLTSFLQFYPIKIGKFQIGAGLPIIMGTSFAFVAAGITVALGAKSAGVTDPRAIMAIVLGGTFAGTLVQAVIGIFYKYLKNLFPPLVIGTVLITIGVHLLTVGVEYFAGGAGLLASKDPAVQAQFGSSTNLILGFTVFAVIMILQRFGKGMWKISSVLIGIIVGYLLAIPMGAVNFASVANAGIFSIPLPLQFGFNFQMGAIFTFTMLFVVSSLETMGNTNGITIAALDREATGEEVSGAILADALGSAVAAVFNTMPNTAFGQNAGIVAMTKVVNKWCVAMGAFTLIVCAFIPKIGALFNAMPSSVLGGAVITVFAMILINGIKMLAMAGFSDRNVIVLGITFGLGLGLGGYPNHQVLSGMPSFIAFFFKDTTACVCLIAILANLIFPTDKVDKARAKAAMHA